MIESRARAETLFLVAAILLLGYLSYLIFQPFLQWVILGFLFAYLFYAPYRGLLPIVRRRGISAAILLVFILALFFLPFVVIGALVFRDITSFAESLQQTGLEDLVLTSLGAIAQAFGVAADSETLTAAADTISDSIRANAAAFLTEFASDLLIGVATFILGLFIFGFTVFYGFVDGPRIVDGVMSVIPLHRIEKNLLLKELRQVTNAVFVGHVLIAFIQAVIGTAGFFILGVPRTFLWGFVMLIAALIPVVGPFIVWVPVGLYLLLTEGPVDGVFTGDRTVAALGVLLVVGPLVSTIDNLLRPKFVGSRADIHPFLVLIGAVGGLLVFGFTGFVVGPLIISLFIALLRVYRTHWKGEGLHGPTAAAPGGRAPRLVPRPRKKHNR